MKRQASAVPLRECDDERPQPPAPRRSGPSWSIEKEMRMGTERTTRSQGRKPHEEPDRGTKRDAPSCSTKVTSSEQKPASKERPRPTPLASIKKEKLRRAEEEEEVRKKKQKSQPAPKVMGEKRQSDDDARDSEKEIEHKDRIIYLEPSSLRRVTEEELKKEKEALEQFKRDKVELLRVKKEIANRAASGVSSTTSSQGLFPTKARGLAECPFCFKALPRRPSKELIDKLQYWIDQRNRAGKDLSATDTIEDVCLRHIGESEILPEGHKRGWPRELNEGKLRKRLEGHLSIMQRRIEEPESSEWFIRAREERKRLGRAADDIGNQMRDLEDSQAGYYGEVGYEVMRGFLLKRFASRDDSPHWLGSPEVAAKRRPLDSSSKFIDKVLLPELICLVIREDYRGDVTMQEAEQIRRESIRYGHLVFPSRPVEGKSIDDDDSDNEVRSCTPPSSQKKRSIKPPRPHKVVSQKQSHNIRPIPLSQKRREVEDDETPLLASSSQSMPTASSSSLSLSLSSSSSASTLAPFSSWDPLPSTPQAISSSSQEPTPSLQAVLEFDASPRKRQRLESLPLSQDSSIAILSSRKQVGDATMNIAEASPTVCLVSDDDDDGAKVEPAQQRPAKTTLCSQTSSVRRKREPQRTILSHTLSQPSPSVVKHDHFRVTGSASTL